MRSSLGTSILSLLGATACAPAAAPPVEPVPPSSQELSPTTRPGAAEGALAMAEGSVVGTLEAVPVATDSMPPRPLTAEAPAKAAAGLEMLDLPKLPGILSVAVRDHRVYLLDASGGVHVHDGRRVSKIATVQCVAHEVHTGMGLSTFHVDPVALTIDGNDIEVWVDDYDSGVASSTPYARRVVVSQTGRVDCKEIWVGGGRVLSVGTRDHLRWATTCLYGCTVDILGAMPFDSPHSKDPIGFWLETVDRGWLVAERQLYFYDGIRFRKREVLPISAQALWGDGEELWALSPHEKGREARVARRRAGTWEEVAVPESFSASHMAGTSRSALWFVGGENWHQWNGSGWREVPAPIARVASITAAGDAVWVAGGDPDADFAEHGGQRGLAVKIHHDSEQP